MKKLFLASLLFVSGFVYSQEQKPDSVKISPDTLIPDTLLLESAPKKNISEKIGKFLGIDREKEINQLKETISYQQALLDTLSNMVMEPKVIIKTVPNLDANATQSLRKDEKFMSDLPKSYGSMSKDKLGEVTKQIEDKILELIRQRDSILAAEGNADLVSAKNNIIQSLEREKKVINLSIESDGLKSENSELTDENTGLRANEIKLKKYLYISIGILSFLMLIIMVVLQRKKINVQDAEIDAQLIDINKKNTYLEHAARLIRHDMHSGINTYIPRGISSLEKRIDLEKAKELKIDGSIKMIKEGLNHTQKVYKSVYEFTNLVKQNVVLEKESSDLKKILEEYVSSTAYSQQVQINSLITEKVNPSLFCTAIDNLIRNGLSYNDSEKKEIKIYMEESDLVVEDNGKGLDPNEFEKIKKNKNNDGLGLSITLAILKEHGFDLTCEKIVSGTKMKVKIK